MLTANHFAVAGFLATIIVWAILSLDPLRMMQVGIVVVWSMLIFNWAMQ